MSTILRQAANAVRQVSRARTFTSSTVTQRDIVQDIYVREIKGYKTVPVAKDAHVGVVKKLSLPPSPRAPAPPTDLVAELSAYDVAEPALASTSAATGASTTPEEGAGGAEAFLTFLEQDLPKPVHHH